MLFIYSNQIVISTIIYIQESKLPVPKLIQEFQQTCKIQNLATPNIYWKQPLQERETFFFPHVS